MIKDEKLPELGAFRDFEAAVPLSYTPKYGPLVVASDNEILPVHRWFRFKEGYSAQLLPQVLESLELLPGKELTLLDPFCGSGTTLLSAESLRNKGWNIKATGIEVNPFIAFVAATKANWTKIRPEHLLNSGLAAMRVARQFNVPLPELTSISEGRCIDKRIAKRILALREAVKRTKHAHDRDGLLLGIASSIEPLSKVRKDGRALRIVADKSASPFVDTIQRKWNEIAADASNRDFHKTASAPRVVRGDGRRPGSSGIKPGSVDLIFTSPPYPNNIDYTEVYKLELWLLGFITSSNDFLKQRRRTLRSHPTAAPLTRNPAIEAIVTADPLKSLLAPALERMDHTKDRARRRLLVGYCADLYEALEQHFICLRPGGYEVLVVGNSLHGTSESAFLFASDLLITAIAPTLGFEVIRLDVARSMKRRLSGNHFLRESIIVLRKPNV